MPSCMTCTYSKFELCPFTLEETQVESDAAVLLSLTDTCTFSILLRERCPVTQPRDAAVRRGTLQLERLVSAPALRFTVGALHLFPLPTLLLTLTWAEAPCWLGSAAELPLSFPPIHHKSYWWCSALGQTPSALSCTLQQAAKGYFSP